MTKYISSIYKNRNKSLIDSGLPGDILDINFSDNFVLCRDKDGKPTAIYWKDSWDFNPYRTSAKKLNKLNFSRFDTISTRMNYRYKNDAKQIIGHLSYARGGKLGKLSASTLGQYFYTIINLAQFCEIQNSNNPLNPNMSIVDLLSNIAYLKAYINWFKQIPIGHKFKEKQLKSLLNLLLGISYEKIKFYPVDPKNLDLSRADDEGHPVIPVRIYMNLLSELDSYSSLIYKYRYKLRDFILKCKDVNFAVGGSRQNKNLKFDEEWNNSGLISLAESLKIDTREKANFNKLVNFIQYILKNHIHCYTGMRDQEVARIKPGCIHEIERDVSDDFIPEIEDITIVNIISTTSKFTGQKTGASWLAPHWILTSIETLEIICNALCEIYEVDYYNDVPLILSSGIIRSRKYSELIPPSLPNNGENGYFTHFCTLNPQAFTVRQEDFNELIEANTNIDFDKNSNYSVGSFWNLSSHQWRRSLAFYAANSKLIDLPTLMTQFKHLSIEMAKYYARDNEKFLKIFIGENYKMKKSERSHILDEYRTAIPIAVVEKLISDIFLSNDTVFGGIGSYASKQKEQFSNGSITILELKSETLKKAKKGEISYRETLLGGCTNPDPCISFLAGDVTACLPCDGSVIHLTKLNTFIADTKAELQEYKEGTAEYVLTKQDLDAAEYYKKRKMRS